MVVFTQEGLSSFFLNDLRFKCFYIISDLRLLESVFPFFLLWSIWRQQTFLNHSSLSLSGGLLLNFGFLDVSLSISWKRSMTPPRGAEWGSWAKTDGQRVPGSSARWGVVRPSPKEHGGFGAVTHSTCTGSSGPGASSAPASSRWEQSQIESGGNFGRESK